MNEIEANSHMFQEQTRDMTIVVSLSKAFSASRDNTAQGAVVSDEVSKIHNIYKSMRTSLQISGFGYFIHTYC
jgi:hypothetical protein